MSGGRSRADRAVIACAAALGMAIVSWSIFHAVQRLSTDDCVSVITRTAEGSTKTETCS